MRWFWFLCLTLAAVSDKRTRSVSCRLLIVCGLCGFFYGWSTGITGHLVGVLAGAGILTLGRITRGAMGSGDGWFILASAGYLTAEETWILLLGSFGISWLLAMVMILARAGGGGDIRNDTIPFLTCMWPVGLWIVI
ncbi:MAG: hypothetical protein HFG75_00045 [Hungatella sp.]|nr:hypothetical protein [Hungatella sp.]